MTDQGRIRNAASGLVVRDEQVLLVRGDWPRPGTWWLPGGGQQAGETLAACVEREVFEETGVRVKAENLVVVREYIQANHPEGHQMPSGAGHRVDAMFRCRILQEPPVLGGPLEDSVQLGVEWVPLDKLPGLRTLPPCLPTVITNAMAADPARGAVYLGDAYA
ncbi:NUDIX domain-containing protein [Streptomyces hesseae]|uniref:NUDIX domain-containing protein n=1 Tax=Streptomyces hesseae TaxID=3075519 RepID=A0ABU2SVW0_9ACTN|nr:NUDIX domain-containing protein [Streptomyces sp. DSM 40473]MDT0453137.1 NUDIX domain-containing protein [Streptomyces sp. DSM 40473]